MIKSFCFWLITFFSIRFIEDAKAMLEGLEASFAKLAEVSHHIDMKQLKIEELLFFLIVCIFFFKPASKNLAWEKTSSYRLKAKLNEAKDIARGPCLTCNKIVWDLSATISSQSSLNFFCSHFRFFCAAVFLKPFPCRFHRSHPWKYFCSHFRFFFCSHIPETISLQLFHRSHPWKYFCSHFRFFFAAVFLKPFPCSYFIAVIPGFFSAAISVFFCSHIPETISLQLFHRSHPWDFFCSHFRFFLQPYSWNHFPAAISSQSSLDFFLQPCLFFLQLYSWNHFPADFIAVIPGFFSAAMFFFAAVFLKQFPCRFHRSHPWNFFCSHFYSISTPIFGQLYSKFKSLLGPFLEPFTCSFFIAAISHFGRAAIFLSVCLYTKRVPKYIICFSRFFLGEHLGAFRSWLLSTDTSCSLLRRRASSATGRSKMQKTCLRRTRNRRSQRKLRRGRVKPPRSDPRWVPKFTVAPSCLKQRVCAEPWATQICRTCDECCQFL